MIINEPGTYNLVYTATDECGNETVVNRELVVEAPVYGIISRSATSSACERIGASALFANPIPQHSDGNGGWVDGSSPFDNIMPWSGMEVVEDATAGTLVKIPKYWYKWTRNGDEMQLEISPTAQDGFFTSPAHADRGDGVGERDFVYVGRYHCATGYKSQTGVNPLGNQTRATFRSGIHGLGNDIWQYDFAMYWTIAMLYLVEFADWNSQAKIGGGCSDSDSLQAMGLTDSMTYHTGTTNTVVGATNYGHIQYRHIEDLWANVYDWCDGIYFSSTDVFAIKNPADFSDTTGGTNVGTRASSSNWTKNFTDPSAISGFEYALYPSAIASSENASRTHDFCSYDSSGNVLFVCSNYYRSQDCGMFLMYGDYSDSFRQGYIGSRLMKLPSA